MFAGKLVVAIAVILCAFVHAQDVPDNSGFLQSLKDFGSLLSEDQRQELKTLVSNPASTKQQVIDGLQQYFKNIGGETEVSLAWP